MATVPTAGHATSTSALRRFARRSAVRAEICDLCGAAVPNEHQHLIDPQNRRILCGCEACAILFDSPTARFRRVPRRVVRLRVPVFTDAQWESLSIPIGLAFFFRSSLANRIVAMYPGPAGATESLLAMDVWQDVVSSSPRARDIGPDVEALLVNRLTRQATPSGREYIAPIDACYRLVGLLRAKWRGFSGGTEAWTAIDRFFADLDAVAIDAREEGDA